MLTYCMTIPQGETWILGGAAAAQVEQEIAEQLCEADVDEDVLVTCDDGQIAYTPEWQVDDATHRQR